ncbi:hypothetical protein V2J56_04795 [Georgenia sp. MJ206]|uniref:hypothetical protein n=1 Tax=Georgenia wangjunii TaxID=3117730 RepID=UPI002F269271
MVVRLPHQHAPAPVRRERVVGAVEPAGLGNAGVTRVLAPASAARSAGRPLQHGMHSVQRGDNLDRAQQQAGVSTVLSWGLRGFQLALALLGLKGLLSGPFGMPVGVDSAGQPIRAHLVPGAIDEVALVVAGVHGSEQSGVEVAERLLDQLAVHRPYFTVVVVPRLFPDNVASRAAWDKKLAAEQGSVTLKKYREVRNAARDPGRVTPGQVDPNRQLPDLGDDLDLANPVDARGRIMEPGAIALLALVNAFSPTRVLSIHAHKTLSSAGIFADPHPSTGASALASEAHALAVDTAKHAEAGGAKVPGNKDGTAWSSLYPGQDPKKSAAQIARENAKGRSLGQWGPSKGIAVLTMEVGEQYRSDSAVRDPDRKVELEAHASAIREVFLGPPRKPAPAPAGAAAPGVQRLVLATVAAGAGNRAATTAAGALRPPGQAGAVGRTPPTVQRDWWDDVGSAATAVVEGAATFATGVAKTATGGLGVLRDVTYGLPLERAIVKRLVLGGVRDADALTQMVYALRHPDQARRLLDPAKKSDKPLIKEWMRLKKELVVPLIARYTPGADLTDAEKERKVRRAVSQAKAGGETSARKSMADDIRAQTKKSVEEWFAGHDPGATFLGLPIRPSSGSAVGGVHSTMLAKLDTAGAAIAALPELAGLSGVELADAIGVHGLGGLRPPKAASGGERPSLHCYGLAVDINYSGNPFVGLNGRAVPDMIERATLLMRGTAFAVTAPPPEGRGVMEQWLLTNNASEDVITYLNMDVPTLEFQIGEMISLNPSVPRKMRSLDWWVGQQKKDRALKGKGDLTAGRDPRKQGVMDLDERLVKALTDAGLTWGGMYRGAKDLMHFDDRSLIRRG